MLSDKDFGQRLESFAADVALEPAHQATHASVSFATRSQTTQLRETDPDYNLVTVPFEGPKAEMIADTFASILKCVNAKNVAHVKTKLFTTNQIKHEVVFHIDPEKRGELLANLEMIDRAMAADKKRLARYYELGTLVQSPGMSRIPAFGSKLFITFEGLSNYDFNKDAEGQSRAAPGKPIYRLKLATNNPRVFDVMADKGPQVMIHESIGEFALNGRDYNHASSYEARNEICNSEFEDAIMTLMKKKDKDDGFFAGWEMTHGHSKGRTPGRGGHTLGFTLIEISIVLVIIGLIVGGILVGNDLINAAKIRGTIKQYESYRTAVNTFHLKYNTMPGDMTEADATALGFAPTSRPGNAAGGIVHGNGLIDNDMCTYGPCDPFFAYETGLFWRDLSSANMIEGSYVLATDGTPTGTMTPIFDQYTPAGKVDGTWWIPTHNNAIEVGWLYMTPLSTANYFMLITTSAVVNGGITLDRKIKPQTAYMLDSKVDDGLPFSGIVMASDDTTELISNISLEGNCGGKVAWGQTYDGYQTRANIPSCMLSFKF